MTALVNPQGFQPGKPVAPAQTPAPAPMAPAPVPQFGPNMVRPQGMPIGFNQPLNRNPVPRPMGGGQMFQGGRPQFRMPMGGAMPQQQLPQQFNPFMQR